MTRVITAYAVGQPLDANWLLHKVGWNHTLVILECDDGKFRLMEVDAEVKGGAITIHQETYSSYSGVLNRRRTVSQEPRRWGHDQYPKNEKASLDKVERIIRAWNGSSYSVTSHNCRHFVDEVLLCLGLESRCKPYS